VARLDERRTSRRWALILSAVIAARVACAALFFYAFMNEQRAWAIGVFLLACFTDALDGYLARRLSVVPSLGSYLDVTADFVLVLAAFSAFVVKDIYPWWTLLLTVGMFVQFVWTSGFEQPLYDPLGKYYGVFLFAAIGVTLAFPRPAVRHVILAGILGFTALSLVSRSLLLARRRKGG
jgi:CDP-diacylglycerol--glycerol-3-phosphate 3-phosphatidyltransferase